MSKQTNRPQNFFDKLHPSRRRLDRELGVPAVRGAQNERRFSGDTHAPEELRARREAQATRRFRLQAGLAVFVVAAGMNTGLHGGLRGTLRDAHVKIQHILDSGAGVPQAQENQEFLRTQVIPDVRAQMKDEGIIMPPGTHLPSADTDQK